MLLIIFTLGKSFQREPAYEKLSAERQQIAEQIARLEQLLVAYSEYEPYIVYHKTSNSLKGFAKRKYDKEHETLHSLLLLQCLSLRNLPQIFALDYWQFQSALFADNCPNHIKDFICSIAYCFNWLGINKLLQLFLCFCHKHFCSKNSLILLHYPAVDIPSLCLYSCPFQRTGFLSQMYLWYGIKALLRK